MAWEVWDEDALGDTIKRLPSKAANPLEALEEAFARMRNHIADDSPVVCVTVADTKGKRVARVKKEEAITHARKP